VQQFVTADINKRAIGWDADVVPFCHADACINLRLVSTAGDLQDSEKAKPFPPEYSERYFGEDGKIYGYKGLKVSECTPADYSQCSS
jgi:hypothetical protein